MSSDPDEAIVILNCINPHHSEAETTLQEILISTAEVSAWDLPTILACPIVKIQSDRSRLIEQSSYFRGLLSGSFSESCLDCISIQWELETFINVLKFMYDCQMDVTTDNFLLLFEGALFFGVEKLLSKCKAWFREITSTKGLCSLQIQLDDLIHIWKFGLEHANDFIPELCTGYLARNFMLAISSNSFGNVPYKLLFSCMKHPHLTVDSEKHLCEAILVWIAANRQCLEDDCTNILKQIHIGLLPLYFSAGKRRCRYFSKFADESIDTILSLTKHPSVSSLNDFGDGVLRLRIRLTEYSKKLDLSGCPQIIPGILLLSVLPFSYTTDPLLRKRTQLSHMNFERLDRGQNPVSKSSFPILSFATVQEMDISNCPRLHLEAAIECFCKSFPSLQILKAAYFLNFKITSLHQLLQKFPMLVEVDLTVDISPVIPAQVSVLSSSGSRMPKVSENFLSNEDYPLEFRSFSLSGPSSSNITKLTLEGRSDISDSDLQNISELCVSLHYLNLKGCISVTDVGISILIKSCIKLHSIVVCDTSFGRNSVLALCSDIPNFPAEHFERKHASWSAFKLQTLHMGGCKGVDETSLQKLLSQTSMLKSICLMGTHLVDGALLSFLGSSLEMLDVSDTMVSGAALYHVVRQNPALKHLKARGCKNLCEQKSEGSCYPHSFKEMYLELGKTCKLEEIALGWGFSYLSLEALKPAIESLRAITVGLGGSLGHDALILLPSICPLLESVILYFQVISDRIVKNLMESLRHLKVLSLCYCIGDISSLSLIFCMPNLRKLKLERVTPWMTNDDLVLLSKSCANLTELSLLGCTLLNSDSQCIISHGWPGLISISLENCGQITANGVASLLDCKALEDLLLRHNGPGIHRNFILDAALKMPMLRKISLDLCDASEGDFELPNILLKYHKNSKMQAEVQCRPLKFGAP
ncbi:BTB/POZ domain-containing protein FBL11 isoform X2 [Malania oleifera]|uniref:BTB/POZ domain-containing protein FBL11 isoform X2 n=1 Tax=Malania oleifera TaxID=397392 RepID=UPI0025ADCF68|nr:BTB/POZ domain-containing protein FBL11 isoform X2 [Malania oleifera]